LPVKIGVSNCYNKSAVLAISFRLSQSFIMIGAFWGVFIWKEFDNAPKASKIMLSLMFSFFIIGIILIVLSGMQ